MKSRLFSLLIVVVLLLAGCGKDGKESGEATPTEAGKATPTVTSTEVTSTPTPSVEPTATPTPATAIPEKPEKYQVKDLVKAAEDEISGFQYAYRETETLGQPTDGDVYFFWRGAVGRNTKAEDPWKLSHAEKDDLSKFKFKYNSRVSYLDADLNRLKERFLLNGKETAVWYTTSLGNIFTYPDGTVLYDFSLKEYNDDGRLLFDMFGYNTYDCYAYDEAGRLSVKARYSPENSNDMMAETLDSYDLYTYDESGHLLREEQWNAGSSMFDEPLLMVYRDYTYDEDGNCISVTYEDTSEYSLVNPESGEANGRYDFQYEKDDQGRLRRRTLYRYSPEGWSLDEKTIEILYYDDGSLLMTETGKEAAAEGGVDAILVVFPDADMAESVGTCTNLRPIYSIWDLQGNCRDSYYEGYLEADDNRNAVEKYQNIPVTKMPITRPLVVYYSWFPDEIDSLLQMQSFDYRSIEIDEWPMIPRLFGYRDGWLEKMVHYEGGGCDVSSFEYDSEHRLVVSRRNGETVEYRYDTNGRLVEKVANCEANDYWDRISNSLERYSYDPDGKLIEASIVGSYQNAFEKVSTRTTTFLFEYSGDGTD